MVGLTVEKILKLLEKQTEYRYSKDGAILVADAFTKERYPRILPKGEPLSVVDTVSQFGRQPDRTSYDAGGFMTRQISSAPRTEIPKSTHMAFEENMRTILCREMENIRTSSQRADR